MKKSHDPINLDKTEPVYFKPNLAKNGAVEKDFNTCRLELRPQIFTHLHLNPIVGKI